MPGRPLLRALADRAGISPEFTDNRGKLCVTSDATRALLLAAMGWDASSEAAVAHALEALRERADTPRLARVERPAPLELRLPNGAERSIEWSLELEAADGGTTRAEGRAGIRKGQRRLRLPVESPRVAGYYTMRATLGDAPAVTQFLIVSPATCTRLEKRIAARRFGIVANLYTLRTRTNWGAGDFTDLEALAQYSAHVGGVFVGLNPLHALRNRGMWVSPYSPSSRLFRNALYVDVARVPELADSPATQTLLASPEWRAELERLRALRGVDYEGVMRLKRAALESLHGVFLALPAGSPRRTAYDAFQLRHGATLRDFATFQALEERFAQTGETRLDWRTWPAPFHDPASPAVREFRDNAAQRIAFHLWVQFELDRQLAEVAQRAQEAGLALGLYGDLAIGSSPGGADHWMFPGLFVDGAYVGAPPNAFSEVGQDWGLPPVHPLRLAQDGFRYWRLLIRNALEHFGALRIDHVMGLFRQYWVPAGHKATEGAYVRFPSAALLAVLAIESQRRGAIIIGEDLGTVPRGVPAALARLGILSSRVLYFERDKRGAFKPAKAYSRRALVTANTHDHAPLAGFWTGRDIELRRAAESLPDEASWRLAVQERARDREALLARLGAEHILPAGAHPDTSEFTTAVHRFLAHTPSPLLGIALDDLAGELEPVNIPGVTAERYRSWTRRMHISLEALAGSASAIRALSGLRSRLATGGKRAARQDPPG